MLTSFSAVFSVDAMHLAAPALQPAPLAPLFDGFIGGCRAFSHRASYYAVDELDPSQTCEQQTACRLCGESCTPETFASGMKLPRHNVPQFLGNAPWDGLARDGFERLVQAMLGDPFAFTIAPEVDALRRLLLAPSASPGRLAEELAHAWPLDERFQAAHDSAPTRAHFLDAIGANFSRAFVLSSEAFAAVGPRAVRRRLRRALTGDAPLTPEGAMCAAVHVADAMFAQRGKTAALAELLQGVWGNDNASTHVAAAPRTGTHGSGSGSGPGPDASSPGSRATRTIFEALYHSSSAAETHDPHGVIYTTPYEANANGWYGGNVSARFASRDDAANGGSGIDINWAVLRGCPMPRREASFCADRRSAPLGCDGMRAQGEGGCGHSGSIATPDAGEIRTPHYKTPREVLSLTHFEWNAKRQCVYSNWDPVLCAHSRIVSEGLDGAGLQYDFSTLARPAKWLLARYDGVNASVPMAYVLAPSALGEAEVVYGVREGANGSFVATSPPPNSIGDDQTLHRDRFVAPDIPASTTQIVPVWGMLYTCDASNLASKPSRHATAPSPDDVRSRCEAARILRRHRENLRNPLYSALHYLSLPPEWVAAFRGMRVWTPNATIDLSAAGDAVGGVQRDVCVLSFASAAEEMVSELHCS